MTVEREVKIYGQVFRVKGDDAERIDQVAAYVDEKMAEILRSPGSGLSAKGAVLTALNIADEWHGAKRETERITLELNRRVDELLSLLPE